MNAKEELIQGIQTQTKEVYYTYPGQKRIFGKRKFKFIIRPIVAVDFFREKMAKEAMKEMSSGQTEDESCRVVAQRFKDKIMSMDEDSLGKMILEKGVVFPRIVDRNINLGENEVPYNMLTVDIKMFLAEHLRRISPIFQG